MTDAEQRRGGEAFRAERRAVVALGANLGDRRATLDAAVERLDGSPRFRVTAVSTFIETDPVGGPAGQPTFLNGVLFGETALSARPLLDLLHAIERQFDRRRDEEVANGPRTLDLDLLLLGDERHDDPDLIVPHPRMEQRLFVLRPLESLDPDLRLPSGARVRERRAVLEHAGDPGNTRDRTP